MGAILRTQKPQLGAVLGTQIGTLNFFGQAQASSAATIDVLFRLALPAKIGAHMLSSSKGLKGLRRED